MHDSKSREIHGVRRSVAGLVGFFAITCPLFADSLTVLGERTLPTPLHRARDIRWETPETVILANATEGVFRLPIAPETPAERLLPGGKTRDSVWLALRLALDDDHLLIASPVYELVWQARGEGVLKRDVLLEHIFDIDLHDGRLLLLGTRRDEGGQRSPEGALAWLTPFHDSPGALRPIAFSSHGPGPQAMDACGSFNLGHVRFFDDGRAVVAPGAEPTVLLFDPTGGLAHTWDLTALGLDIPCHGLSQERKERLAADPDARWAWLDQYETLDEVLALPAGAVLITRRITERGTRWRAILLVPGAPNRNLDLPFDSPSRRTHLRADFDGSRLAFLFFEEERPERALAATPRLVVTENLSFFAPSPAIDPTTPETTPTSP